MVEKKQLNVRIPVDLAEEIDGDGRPKVDIVVEALKLYFDSKKHPGDSSKGVINNNASKNDDMASKNGPIDSNNSNNDISDNSNDITIDSNCLVRKENEVDFLRSKVDELLKLLHQEQVLHIQTQRMLTAPENSQLVRKWWQFWR